MEKVIIKHYVEKKYTNGTYSIEEISEPNPIYVADNDNSILAIRFFDKEFIKINGKLYTYVQNSNDEKNARINESNWIYFGEKLSLVQLRYIQSQEGNNPKYSNLIKIMVRNGHKYVCHPKGNFEESSFIIMNKGDITFEEYLEQKKKNAESETNKALLKEKKAFVSNAELCILQQRLLIPSLSANAIYN